MQKKILVTGGAGFLGSHLCDRLIETGHDVLCVDNFFTGSKENVAHLIGHPRFDLLRHDVTFPLYAEVDGIYNLACPASPIHYQHDPVQTTKTRVHGVLKGEDITIYGAGQQTRSFCFVDDLVEAMLRMMGTASDVTGPVNIGNPGDFTMLELAEAVIRLTKSKSKPVFLPLPQDDPKQRRPDISLAKEALGWTPKVDLEAGLGKTIEYFAQRIRQN
jgi:nucleoside-diphosphate-sugar epimerase